MVYLRIIGLLRSSRLSMGLMRMRRRDNDVHIGCMVRCIFRPLSKKLLSIVKSFFDLVFPFTIILM